jgi:hypothetical protein
MLRHAVTSASILCSQATAILTLAVITDTERLGSDSFLLNPLRSGNQCLDAILRPSHKQDYGAFRCRWCASLGCPAQDRPTGPAAFPPSPLAISFHRSPILGPKESSGRVSAFSARMTGSCSFVRAPERCRLPWGACRRYSSVTQATSGWRQVCGRPLANLYLTLEHGYQIRLYVNGCDRAAARKRGGGIPPSAV